MKKLIAIVALVSSAFLLAPRAGAAEKVKGTIVKVDDGARTVTFRQERADADQVLPVDGAVDLKGVKANAKAELTLDGGVVKEIRVAEKKARAPGY
jgi:hypothetical protein